MERHKARVSKRNPREKRRPTGHSGYNDKAASISGIIIQIKVGCRLGCTKI